MQVPVLVDALLGSDIPSIRWKTRLQVLGEEPTSRRCRQLQREIKDSQEVRAILANRDASGRIPDRTNVYDKWLGSHWIFANLADLGYPAGDKTLRPIRDQVVEFWTSPRYQGSFAWNGRGSAPLEHGVLLVDGRARRCASQQGNTLFAAATLGLTDHPGVPMLANLLMSWQWPDGGWNCDRRPATQMSSFMETLTPMRGLAAFGKTGSRPAAKAAKKAAEVFLERRLYKRRRDGAIIDPVFAKLHYPLYWHYDILGGLKGLMEAGMIRDARCNDALDLLESKQLPDGGWPAERRYYNSPGTRTSSHDYIDWGGTSKKRSNPWVTVDALAVLRAAGRLEM